MQVRDVDASATLHRLRQRRSGVLRAAGGLLGLMGVGISAAATHRGGGELATTAGQFCLFHAAAVLGLSAMDRAGLAARLGSVAGWVLFTGTLLFSGDLAAVAFAGSHAFPMAAPLGGAGLLAGWALVVAAGITEFLRR